MLIRCGFLFVSESIDSESDGAVLTEVQTVLGGVLDGVLLLESRVFATPPRYQVEETLRGWCDEEELDLIVTVGGTFPAPGPSAQEIVPEATAAVLERLVPSLPETMRARAAAHPLALLDRGVAGIRGRTLILNLPSGHGLTVAFLESVLDLIPSILARLQPENTLPAAEAAPASAAQTNAPPRSSGSGELSKDEFAAFLRRRQAGG